MNDLVTILTPLYNAESYFRDTADSVLKQTYVNWEWIIIDDCSTDGSFDIAKEYSLRDKRIILLKLQKNSGSAAARNKGLDLAKGRYISFLDADDLIHPDYLQRQLEFIRKNGPIVSAAYERLTEKTRTVFYVPEKVTYKSILKGNPLSCLSTMYDKGVFPNDRFPEDMRRHEDYFFWISLLRKGYCAFGNKNVLATYRINKSSKNADKAKLLRPLYYLYHKKMGINFLKSFIMVLRYAVYSRKKYKGVK